VTTYGVLGVGSLATFIVTGLCEGVADPPEVVLSPRNGETAARLAAAYPTVTVAADNQAVLDAADVVLVLLRRQHADALLDLAWRPDHVVVSAVAGLPVSRLAEMVAPAVEVARAAAMPAVSTRSSRTPVHPPVPAVLALFERLGGAMPVESDDEFEAIFTSMGTVVPFFEYLKVLAAFLSGHGVDPDDAQRLVAATFLGTLGQLAAQEQPDFAEIIRENAPPGGGNEQLTNLMREEGVFEGMGRAIEEVHRRLTGRTA
jgi:pyrroline-5-carboxylate reductase